MVEILLWVELSKTGKKVLLVELGVQGLVGVLLGGEKMALVVVVGHGALPRIHLLDCHCRVRSDLRWWIIWLDGRACLVLHAAD